MGKNTARYRDFIASRDYTPPSVVFKYTSLDTARKILQSRQVWWQSPLQFNDPFDVQWDTLWQRTTPSYLRRLADRTRESLIGELDWSRIQDPRWAEILRDTRTKLASMPQPERDAHVADLVQHACQKKEIPSADAQRSDLVRRLRIFCVAASPDCPLMWGHYGDKHQGVLLAFNTSVLEDAWEVPLQPVTYSSSLPETIREEEWLDSEVFGLEAPPVRDQDAERWSLTKAVAWSYEKEWRFASRAEPGAPGTYNAEGLPFGSIGSVAGGCRSDMRAVTSLANEARKWNPDLRVFQYLRLPDQFGLVRTP